jgi:hypothetical protein
MDDDPHMRAADFTHGPSIRSTAELFRPRLRRLKHEEILDMWNTYLNLSTPYFPHGVPCTVYLRFTRQLCG